MSTTCPKCQTDNPDESKFCMECATPFPSAGGAVPTRTLETPIKGFAEGTIIAGKYKIIEVLGKGGMGVVYKAEDTKLKRTVALKFLSPELTRNSEAKERFMLEAQAASALDHNNICTVHEIDESDEQMFIAMAYVDGQSLREKIIQGSLKLEEALAIATQITAGLHEAHEKGIVHRDIKSSNIMITSKDQAMIMDFGIAKLSGETKFTRTGTTMGTVAYMSPEQARGEKVDHRSDLWSLGIVMYEMLSGQLPFIGDQEASILYSVVHEEAKPLKALKPDVPSELQQIVNRALKKKPEARYTSASEMLNDLKKYQDSLKAEEMGVFSLSSFIRLIRKPIVVIPTLIVVAVVCLAAIWFFNRQAKIHWTRDTLLPKINDLVMAEGSGRDNLIDAYRLVQEAEKYLSGDPTLSELASKCAVTISIKTEPPGAQISLKKYSAPDSEWEYLGTSPINNIQLPMGIFRWKMEKEGYENVLAASFTYRRDESRQYFNIPNNFTRVLDEKGNLPPGMVRVAGGKVQDIGHIEDFFIDQFEVTNLQFKEFVDQGGYKKKEYWKKPFVKDENALTWEAAMTEFVDQTGRPGPSNWQAGAYPKGQEDYPVSGVSWYEAAAFAEFSGKSLPTGHHWAIARGELTPLYQSAYLSILYPLSNFQDEGPATAGSYQGITAYGVYDMAGNVREWCWNETPQGRLMRGGAWNDINYMFGNLSQSPPFDRSPKNGFRCVRYIDPQKIPEIAFQPAKFAQVTDFYQLSPVADSVFQVYKDQFSYDKKDLNARVESTDDKARDWIKERVTFDTAYENERMMAYLFLPKNSLPPYQTVIYFPGSSAQEQKSSQDLEKYVWFEVDLSFLLQNGRAVLFPIYAGTFERVDPKFLASPPESHLNTEYYIQVIRELRRCIDYLEIRSDIDAGKIAFLGFSWGARLGAIIPAIEERLKVSILKVGGLRSVWRPEINQINYVSRVKLPTLMLNGKYDMTFPYETSAKPMFDLLGTPREDKAMKLYDTDHFIPHNEFIKETLSWLDRYLGPVTTRKE
ncbi:MAG: protein kinase [Candidatus Aminicenantes bacterium]|nr:protein kinase [Candidatus Aminicenantes bacterium]